MQCDLRGRACLALLAFLVLGFVLFEVELPFDLVPSIVGLTAQQQRAAAAVERSGGAPAAAADAGDPARGAAAAARPDAAPGPATSAEDLCGRDRRLHIVSAAGLGYLSRAKLMQRLIVKRFAAGDTIVNVCDQGCKAKAQREGLGDVIEVPDSPDGARSLRNCSVIGKKKLRPCPGNRLSQIKFVFGLVAEVRRWKASGCSMPRWWLVKDDDTYVHVPNLMDAVRRHDPDGQLHNEIVAFGALGCPPTICGGAGWLLSRALAEEVALKHGDTYIKFQMDKIMSGKEGNNDVADASYDLHVRFVLKWFNHSTPKDHMARLIRLPEMNPYSPEPAMCSPGQKWECFETVACNCSQSPAPATWHMNRGYLFKRQLPLLEAEP